MGLYLVMLLNMQHTVGLVRLGPFMVWSILLIMVLSIVWSVPGLVRLGLVQPIFIILLVMQSFGSNKLRQSGRYATGKGVVEWPWPGWSLCW